MGDDLRREENGSNLLICEAITHSGQQLTQSVLVDVSYRNDQRYCSEGMDPWNLDWQMSGSFKGKAMNTCVFHVEASKSIPNHILWICTIQFLPEHS